MDALTTSSSSHPVQLQPNQQLPPPWEFTRRKRWADLLITELSEAIVLVLSPTGKVLFCNPAVREILGWQDGELIDKDFMDFLNVNDRRGFYEAYARSIQRREDLHFYARLFCKSDSFTHMAVTPPAPDKEILLEIMGYPHFVLGDSACKCFFVVAKPYPSRNTAMLNTLLELKVENERLQQHLSALRAHSQRLSATQSAQHMASYAGDDLSAQLATNLGLPSRSTLGGDSSRPQYSMPHGYEAGGDIPTAPSLDDDGDAERRRKKLKKSLGGEQHICNTCGRTDSPEWRKGPRGPKTLCNACGLRWAKKVRKYEEAAEAGDTKQLPLDDTVPP